jgi:hypothetical protein
MTPDPTRPDTLERELGKLLNDYTQENASNTPDFILAAFLLHCLAAFNEASRARETWYGRALCINDGDAPWARP